MPAFDDTEMSEEQLTAIHDYLTDLEAPTLATKSTWWNTDLLNLPTPALPRKGDMEVHFTHRFSDSVSDAGRQGFYGLDSFAFPGFWFIYTAHERVAPYVGRTANLATWEYGLKIALLREHDLGVPISVAANIGGAYLDTEGIPNAGRFTAELPIGVRAGDRIALQVVPMYATNPDEFGAPGSPGFSTALGVGGSFKLNTKISLDGEYITNLGGYERQPSIDQWQAGVTFHVHKHWFSLLLTNSTLSTPDFMVGGSFPTGIKSNIRIGFNLVRAFLLLSAMSTTMSKFKSRRLVPARSLIATIALCALGTATAQSGVDDFSNSDFDGGWVGTLTVGKSRVPIQLNMNIDGGGGAAFVIVQDPNDSESAGVATFDADLVKVSNKSVTLRIDDTAPVGRFARAGSRFGTGTLKISYKAGTDSLSGKASGSLKGKLVAVRMDTTLPMQRLWQGSFKTGGETLAVRMATTEDGDGTVGGHANLDGETATVVGTRQGTKVEMTLTLGGQTIEFSGKLKAKNSALQGTFKSEGETNKVKLVAGSGKGKPMSFKNVNRLAAEVPAGEQTTLQLTGKNLAPGALAFSDSASVAVRDVEFVSSKSIRVTVEPDANTDDGTSVSLRMLSGDGQVKDRGNAFSVTNGGGGGVPVSFAAQIQPIFTNSCASAGCHNSGSARAGLVLESGASLANLVNSPSSQQPGLRRVLPGDPDSSYLIRKIEGGPAITGGRMPLNRTALSDTEVALIRLWITEGANGAPEPLR
ncbi:MAG: hypothetical protein GKS06_11670 [Acidobacteria bacterium]|nr:hypothetical protein [Acidobacteriota bacterium]